MKYPEQPTSPYLLRLLRTEEKALADMERLERIRADNKRRQFNRLAKVYRDFADV